MKRNSAVLKLFGEQMGLPDLKFDECQMCQLKIEGTKLAIYDNQTQGCISLICEIPDVAMDGLEVDTWYRLLFERQMGFLHENIPVVGFNSASKALLAMSHIVNRDVSLERLSEKLNALVDWVLESSYIYGTRTLNSARVIPTPHHSRRLGGAHYA
ncbi:CesT family type III secretion system chaperone [Pseudomonas rhodesiae]|uniref:CesT family type III secretion system chaperone n=1 Tax=Pseudomonas rhodesiae TaxID=76760 RepID=UPI0032B1B94B